jgi:transcription initiation factor TFIID subunit TAF12
MNQHAIPVERIKSIVSENWNEEIDDSTTEAVAELMDRMLESIVDWSVKVADSRGSNALDVEDIRFIAEQEWGVSLKESLSIRK